MTCKSRGGRMDLQVERREDDNCRPRPRPPEEQACGKRKR